MTTEVNRNHESTPRMNIVFDLGGVVFRWQPDAIIRSVFSDPEVQALARERIFQHPDWLALDRGSMSQRQAIERAAARTGIARQDLQALFQAVPRQLTPIDDTIQLIRDVRTTASGLYVLSNMHEPFIAHLEQHHRIWSLFDGAVISCRVGMIKPEPAIYEHLLHRYRLNAAETVFIDDMAANVDAAAALGIRTIRFTEPGQCRRALAAMGCL